MRSVINLTERNEDKAAEKKEEKCQLRDEHDLLYKKKNKSTEENELPQEKLNEMQ